MHSQLCGGDSGLSSCTALSATPLVKALQLAGGTILLPYLEHNMAPAGVATGTGVQRTRRESLRHAGSFPKWQLSNGKGLVFQLPRSVVLLRIDLSGPPGAGRPNQDGVT